MKLLLYSAWLLAPEHRLALAGLAGKAPETLTYAAITNALDVEDGTDEWLPQTLESLGDAAQVEVVDLRSWGADADGLRAKLASKDVIWLSGGNGFYLRWILRESGADAIIRELVGHGAVYAGWSAGAVLAGPTLRHFEHVENVDAAPEVLHDALGLTDLVVLPHMDLEEFGPGMNKIDALLRPEGYQTIQLTEAQAVLIDGERRQLLDGADTRDL